MSPTSQFAAADLPTDDRVVRACLLRAVEPGTREVIGLANQIGVRDTLAAIASGHAIGECDVDGMRARLSPGCGERDLAAANAAGARLVVPGDAQWPAVLDDLDRLGLTCFGIYVRGTADLAVSVQRSLSIVGTRAATDYGAWAAAELAAGLAQRGWAVVSGLAYGIDAVYPKAHAGLLARIVATGAVISEQAPGSAPHRIRFLVRNRLIAALSAGTLVVEAAARSGARTTARYAGALGRSVMAVPGPITSTTSVGCHQLVRDDPAVGLVTCVDDIIEMAGAIGDLAPRPQGPVTARDALPALDRKVLESVPVKNPAALERIALTAGVSVHRTDQTLQRLALGSYVEHVGPLWRLSATQRSQRRATSGQNALDLDW